MKVTMLKQSQGLEAGKVYEVRDGHGESLIRAGFAVPYEPVRAEFVVDRIDPAETISEPHIAFDDEPEDASPEA